ncbi:MAG TPA: GatB/YqeY domain-containing protein [Propionibacteriaceae bacterium]|nr:GatB/YqeY domain-containing protein [Propionibacteriaceae bacterium]
MGALKDQLRADLVTAMKAKDEAARSNVRMALAAIQNEEVAGKEARELTDDEEIRVVTREVNKRKDSAQAYADGGRPELAAKEAAEAEFLSRYLPAQMGDHEIRAIVDTIITRQSAGGDRPTMKQMGQVMKAVTAEVAGRADGRRVSQLVREALA